MHTHVPGKQRAIEQQREPHQRDQRMNADAQAPPVFVAEPLFEDFDADMKPLPHPGGSGEEFDDMACKMIFRQTHGVPRLVNQFCDFALLYAWTNETRTVNEEIVRQVIDDGVFFGGNSLKQEASV